MTRPAESLYFWSGYCMRGAPLVGQPLSAKPATRPRASADHMCRIIEFDAGFAHRFGRRMETAPIGARHAQPFRGPGGVHRGVAAAVDHDSASQHALAAGSHVAQRYGIEHLGGVARRYVDMLCEMRADRHKNGVELTRRFGFQHILDFTIENDLDAELFDAFDLGHELGARKPVRGDTEMQHPAGQRTSIVDFDVVTEALEMIPCRQPSRAGAYNQDALS